MTDEGKAWGKPCIWYPTCPMKTAYEQGILDERWVREFCHGNWGSCVRYLMEERGEPHPDCMLPDGSRDETLRARRKEYVR